MLDAHCHLDRYKEPIKVIAESAAHDVFIIAVTNLPSHFLMGYSHIKGNKKVRLALGLHPLAASEHQQELETFHQLIDKTSFVGEVGLDFSRYGIQSRTVQLQSFRAVAKLVTARKKIISLHSRGAESAVLDILTEFKVQPAIFHWYSGPISVLEEIAEGSHFFSVNPAMMSSKKGKTIIDRIPPGQLLTETDGPYTKVEGHVSYPWHILVVEEYLAEIWGVKPEEARAQIWLNFRKLLRLVGLSPE